MELERIFNVKKSFNEKVEQEKDPVEKLKLMEKYYNWLRESLNVEEDVKAKVELSNDFYRLLYGIAACLQKMNVKLKDLSDGWNGALVGRTYRLSKDRSKTELQNLMEDLIKEEDFPTKAYCYQVLQQDGVVDFSKLMVTEKQMRTVQRPKAGGGTVADDGSKYWHTGAKELMTYDECTERGLGHHLLAYPMGHSLSGCYLCFDEPNRDLVKGSKDPVVNEWVEDIMSK